MLGSLASIIPERKNAHHTIRQSLDSHDNVEVEAAIFAAASFSAQSKYGYKHTNYIKYIWLIWTEHFYCFLFSGTLQLGFAIKSVR